MKDKGLRILRNLGASSLDQKMSGSLLLILDTRSSPSTLRPFRLWRLAECMGIHMLLRSLTPSLSRPPAFQLLRPLVLGLTARAVGPRRLLQQSHKHYFGGGFERAKKNTGSEYRGKIKRKNESSTTHQHRAPSYVKGGRVLDRTTGNTFNPDKQVQRNSRSIFL
jgi:hypothetical protein